MSFSWSNLATLFFIFLHSTSTQSYEHDITSTSSALSEEQLSLNFISSSILAYGGTESRTCTCLRGIRCGDGVVLGGRLRSKFGARRRHSTPRRRRTEAAWLRQQLRFGTLSYILHLSLSFRLLLMYEREFRIQFNAYLTWAELFWAYDCSSICFSPLILIVSSGNCRCLRDKVGKIFLLPNVDGN